MAVCVLMSKSLGVGVFVYLSAWLPSHPTTAAMCVLFVDKFAGLVLLRFLGPDQTHSEVMEHTGVTVRLTDGEPLKWLSQIISLWKK